MAREKAKSGGSPSATGMSVSREGSTPEDAVIPAPTMTTTTSGMAVSIAQHDNQQHSEVAT